jgi:hypothetical protein
LTTFFKGLLLARILERADSVPVVLSAVVSERDLLRMESR